MKGVTDDMLKKCLIDFAKREKAVPRSGAIIINPTLDKVLGVYASFRDSKFAFPKGKRAQNEDPYCTAVREVLEETGLDISPYSSPHVFHEVDFKGAPHVFYVCSFLHCDFISEWFFNSIFCEQLAIGIPDNTVVRPRKQHEIRVCSFVISTLSLEQSFSL